ncbi:hypothetical protein Pint_06841 [Pistacia integerrima]|uniref:Uncharacterized protein n=1 Tax=Pistacia integerrima TaxID=434235 RepID=A0ACC0XV08_9ROSI|nr:hypothetical protein Pint_06841 [Pistacia integerrima]
MFLCGEIRLPNGNIVQHPYLLDARDVGNGYTLEEEHADLLSDKAGESEFWECLKDQIEQVKGLSYVLKCDCGKEYKVEVNL